MNSFVKGYGLGYRDSQAKVDGSLGAFQARAFKGVQAQRDKYKAEALAWRALYEELRTHIAYSPEAYTLTDQADKLLSESRE